MDPKAQFRSGPKGAAPGGIAAAALPGPATIPVSCAIITNFLGSNNTKIQALLLDNDGMPHGEALEVWALSYDPREPAGMGVFDLTECHPRLAVNSIIRIVWQRLWRTAEPGTGEWCEGWWTWDWFMITGCDAP